MNFVKYVYIRIKRDMLKLENELAQIEEDKEGVALGKRLNELLHGKKK